MGEKRKYFLNWKGLWNVRIGKTIDKRVKRDNGEDHHKAVDDGVSARVKGHNNSDFQERRREMGTTFHFFLFIPTTMNLF